jgi:hypothetical protein
VVGVNSRKGGGKISSYINKFKKTYVVIHLRCVAITQHYTVSNVWKGRGTKWSWSNVR